MCLISIVPLRLTYTRMHGNDVIDTDLSQIRLRSQKRQFIERFAKPDIDAHLAKV